MEKAAAYHPEQVAPSAADGGLLSVLFIDISSKV